jgi:hypothetical protein
MTQWATVSGSFHQAMAEVQRVVAELTDLGVVVLSPADPRIVDQLGDFLFVASDRLRSVRLVQQRHLAAIRASDLVWLVAPDGYVGTSAAMEIGFAAAVNTPIYSDRSPRDTTLGQYVRTVGTVSEAVAHAQAGRTGPLEDTDLLLDPDTALGVAHEQLDVIHRHLIFPGQGGDNCLVDEPAARVRGILQSL